MADKTVSAKIQLNITGADKVAREIGAVNKQVEATRSQIERFQKQGGLNGITAGADRLRLAEAQLARLALELDDVEKEAIAVKKAIADTSDATKLDQLNRKFLQLEEAAAGFRLEIAKIPRDVRESVTDTVGYLGDIDTGLSTLAGGAATIGGSVQGVLGAAGLQTSAGPFAGIAGGLQIGAEAFAAAEALPRLTNALGTMRERLGQVSLESLKANKNLLSTGAAIGIMGAAVIGISLLAQKGKDDLNNFISAQERARQRTADLQAQLEQLAGVGDIQRLKEANEARRAAIQDEIKALEDQIASNSNTRIQNVVGSDLFRGGFDPLGTVSKGLDKLGVNTDEADAKLEELNHELEALEDATAQLDSALAGISVRAREAANELDNQLDRYLTFIRLETDGTIEELDRMIAETRQLILGNQQVQVDAVEATYNALVEQARLVLSPEAFAQASDFSQGFDVAIENLKNGILNAGQQIVPGTVDLINKLNEYNGAIDQQTVDLNNLLNPALRDNIALREQEAARLKEMSDAYSELEQVTKDLADAEAEIAKEREREQREATRNAQVTQIEAGIAAAEAKERASNQAKALNKIREDSGKQERSIIQKTANADRDARQKLLNSISQINRDFMTSELKAWADYRLEEQRITEKSSRERLRLIEDVEAGLNQAVRDNNISAFIEASTQGRRDLNRFDEDTSVEGRERSEDFQRERAQAAAERETRLRDLQTQFETERQQRQQQAKEELNQLQTQTAEKLAVQQAAGQQEVSESQALRQQLADLREKWSREDANRERNERQRAQQQEVNELRRHQTTLFNTIQGGYRQQLNQVGQVGQAMANIWQQTLNAINRTRPAGSSSTNRTAVANKLGGVYDKPTLGLLAEEPGVIDVVAGIRASEGLQAGLRRNFGNIGGDTYHITVHANVGELVTPSEVNAVVEDLRQGIAKGLKGD